MYDEEIDTRKVGLFLGLAFGLSWASSVVMYLADVGVSTRSGTLLIVLFYMWAPAVAAIYVSHRHGEGIREETGLFRGRLGWVAAAWLTPVALVGATVGVGTLLPDVSFTTDYTVFFSTTGMSEEQISETVSALESLPLPPVVVFVGQGLVVGLTVNALAALGEELGWRGLLLKQLSSLGFWKTSLVTGVVWGIWHAPVVLQGHNFPDSPVVGVLMMTVAVTALTPIYTYLTVRAESVLAAVFLHGSFNGLGSLSLIYLAGGSNLLVSSVGVAGTVAAVLVTGVCVAHDRLVADEPITTGEPLRVWK